MIVKSELDANVEIRIVIADTGARTELVGHHGAVVDTDFDPSGASVVTLIAFRGIPGVTRIST